jgi:hypothetical protein
MSEPLLMVHTYKLADESAYRSGLTAWFDYIAGNHPHVLHHKVYVDEATGGDRQSPGAPLAGVDGEDVAAVHGQDG